VSNEEEELYNKLKNMKRENELLMVIYEELDELISSGYNGKLQDESTEGLFYSINEYKKWKSS